ncbi:hypothetical protein niasHT_017636 [Heterodera trifolii]|uniref:Sodium/calcium exchanger membrane region domain-containing protein n=1 Tax=Heterodera trifolii TaxID=157864 RepID=A0ABD2L8G3_9BILA
MPPNHEGTFGTIEAGCQPDDFANFGFSSVCQYVKNHSELCDGGGYLQWTEYALCFSPSSADASPPFSRVLVLLCSVLFFILLFVHLSITADSFFCKNITAIVDLHRISQNIAGVTFMAFGNGAPDIFSSIASVISAKRPRADLAISELLGGGIFVTTCVLALIAIIRPFHLMRRPILRDLFFYLLALSLLVYVSFSSRTMQLWHPCAFLTLYLVYAACVVGSNLLRQRVLQPAERRRRMHAAISRFSMLVPPKSNRRNKVAPMEDNGRSDQKRKSSISSVSTTTEALDGAIKSCATPQPTETTRTTTPPGRRPMAARLISMEIALSPGTLVASPAGTISRLNGQLQQNQTEAEDGQEEGVAPADAFLGAGKFFAKEELDELCGDEGTEFTASASDGDRTPSVRCCTPSMNLSSSISVDERQCVVSAQSEAASSTACPWKAELGRALRLLCPLDTQRLRHSAWPKRLFLVAKIPSLFLLRLTVPCASQHWSKPISALHAFMAPLLFCAAFQCLKTPLPFVPPFVLGELALLLSVLLALFVLCCTKHQKEPSCYKRCAAYFGFAISIAWIYATASEVMNVVLMFGTISGIPHQILGLTAIAWANSIGDLIADVTVARQGMSRMAFSAAIGAPLFNLMVGFGTTFLIAELQGKVITIEPDPVTLVMFVFLALSLLCILLLLVAQKFFVRPLHGFVLLTVYALFLVLAILASRGTLSLPSEMKQRKNEMAIWPKPSIEQ